ncbi:MAG: fibronectin type III domain-containing protein [Chloroflexi bacterium]|nr:fibronectin type III domain-containing protein [Chloroflexota bacterium]
MNWLRHRRQRIQRLFAVLYIPLVLVVLAAGGAVSPSTTAAAGGPTLAAGTVSHVVHSVPGSVAPGSPLGPSLRASAAAPAALAAPSGLDVVPLDSSLHVTWTPSSDPATAWMVASAWDGDALQGTKVVGKTARAAQVNGLMPGHTYTVQVQAMDANGGLSAPAEVMATTAPQPPMQDAAFFENFNGPGGDLDANVFDVRSSYGTGLRPEDLGPERFLVINAENHFHTQLIGGKQRAELYIRPRVPFDFAGRTGTFQVEVDVGPTQHSEGKWWEIHLVKDLPWSAEEFGAGRGDNFPDSLEFSSRASRDPETDQNVNIPQITVNIGGTVQTFVGTTPQITPTNIRIPVVIRVSETSAEVLMNGVSVVQATGLRLPFNRGYWVLAHRGWYAPRDTRTTPVALQLVHWETIQFDGPSGSYSPVVRSYLQPGCSGVVRNEHNEILGCPKLGFSPQSPTRTVPLTIPDDVSSARSARLLFNGSANAGFTVQVNGHPVSVPTKTCCYFNALNTVEFPASWLRQGANTLAFSYDGSLSSLPELTQVELEMVYNQARDMTAAPMAPMPMIGATSQNYRVDHVAGDPAIHTLTTYLYSQGAVNPVPFSASVITPQTPWLTVSPASGGLVSPVLGGSLTPLTLQVNAAALSTDSDGEVGVVRVDGASMPVYIAVLGVNDGSNRRPDFISSFRNQITTFNRDAIPNYGLGNTPPPAQGSRPPIRLATTPDGAGALRITVTVGHPSAPLQSIRFGAAKNALIDIAGRRGERGNFTVSLASGTQQIAFTVRREVQGQPTTVPLILVDRYGDWPTFVGGGPSAF